MERALSIGYAPQESSLAPWMKVRGNIRLGLSLRADVSDPVLEQWLNRVVAELKLGPFLNHYPDQLSLGTIKRVSLARALVLRPGLLLLDEPFAGLDFDLRERAMALIDAFLEENRGTLLFVTHEPYEASQLGELAWVLGHGPDSSVTSLSRDGQARSISGNASSRH